MAKKVQFSITLSPEIYEELIMKSEDTGLSKAGYITYALKQAFQADEVKKQLPDLIKVSEQIRDLQIKLENQGK